MMENKLFTIFEYDKLKIGEKDNPVEKTISKQTYDTLLDLYEEDENKNVNYIFNRGYRFLTSKNYVGTVFLKNQTRIEILPKINCSENTEEALQLICEMLQVCKKINPKEVFGRTDLNKNSSLFEIYIYLFCKEVNDLIKRGLKSNYINIEENATRFTGKILFQKHLTTNFIHRERVYISHDIFDINRPENKLIKSALLKVKKYTNDKDNKKNVNILLSHLEEVEPSTSIDNDFAKCYRNANNKEYEFALIYAKLFLKNLTFNVYDTSKHNYAFLFPMDRLFEEYVFHKTKEFYGNKNIKVRTQTRAQYLFETPFNKIQLRPDIMAENIYTNQKIIYDTKWKMIKDIDNDVFVGDFYQMYAYHKRTTNTIKVILLYPYIHNGSDEDYSGDIIYKTDNNNTDITIRRIKLPIKNYIGDFISKFELDRNLLCDGEEGFKEMVEKSLERMINSN